MAAECRPGKGRSIDAIYAAVCTEPDGGERVLSGKNATWRAPSRSSSPPPYRGIACPYRS